MITSEMLKNDCNFYCKGTFGAPAEVMDFMEHNADSYHRYVSYIYEMDHEIVLRTWAFRNRNGFEYTEVERKTLNDIAVRKNIYLTVMSGYRPVYKPQTHPSSSNWYGYCYNNFDAADFNKWFNEPEMGICTVVLNMNRLFEIEKYKYCGFSGGCNLFRYLEFYNKEPLVELFGKIGIEPGANYIRLAKKDKQFIRFLRDNAEEIRHGFFNQTVVIWAYKNKCSFYEARKASEHRRIALMATAKFEHIKQTKVDRVKLYDWLHENDISIYSYQDYFKAIYSLGLDLDDTKNLYPKDFRRMHDFRINQYKAQLAEIDAKKRAELYERFRNRASQYKDLEVEGEKYSIIIPGEVSDLVKEGDKLKHCVGRMGYDNKMAEGKCIIAFIRLNTNKKKPFVTVEYLTDMHRISQCYGKNDSRPDDEVREFADKWAKTVKKKLVRMAESGQ